MRFKLLVWLTPFLLSLCTVGCGSFMARRMAQSPNTYPSWLAPKARVVLAFDDKFLTNFPTKFVKVGPPPASLRYRIIEPADYHLTIYSSNWTEHGRPNFKFSFDAMVPGTTNRWTASPRGTVVLLHGYGLGQFAMAPWGLRLAQEGWRSVLLDLRGHGKSTGQRIYYGIQEAYDLSQLLDTMQRDNQLRPPVAALGESYGAALALRWKANEPRLDSVVAVAPFAVLSNAVLNICHEYANWFPDWLLKSGLKELPSVLEVEGDDLNTTTLFARKPIMALFVAGTADKVTLPADVQKLYAKAAAGSEFLLVTNVTHEALPYYFNELVPPVLKWLGGNGKSVEH